MPAAAALRRAALRQRMLRDVRQRDSAKRRARGCMSDAAMMSKDAC